METATHTADTPVQGKYVYRYACTIIMTAIAAGSFMVSWYTFASENNQTGHLLGYGNLAMAALLYIGLFALVGSWLHAFKIGVDRKASVIASQVLTVATVDIIEIFLSMAITGEFRYFGAFVGIYFILFLIQSACLIALVIPMINVYRRTFPPLRLAEIYGDREHQLADKINGVPYKYHIERVIHYTEGDETVRQAIADCDAILINDLPSEPKNRVLKMCYEADRRVYFVPKLSDIITRSAEGLYLFDTPMFLSRNTGMGILQQVTKRFCDIVLSLVAIVVLSPVMLITALAIHLEDSGPVLYRQERVTYGGRRFMILKFRSMIVNAESDGRPHPAGEQDDRITKVGHFIRACRIDELPQLINILRGEMSIVGPRPERVEHVALYTQMIPEFAYRTKVKAGLTGMAQVYGRYNTTALDKLKYDLIYITNYSIILDLQIIFETLKILTQKESTEGFTEERVEQIYGKGNVKEHKT